MSKFWTAALAFPVFFSVGCGGGIHALKTAEPPRSAATLQTLTPQIALPASVAVDAPDTLPSVGGAYSYPLKQYLEKVFKDAAGAAFAEDAGGSASYSLQVTALASKLEPSGRKARFTAQINTVLRGPDNKVLENINYSGSASSAFDKSQVPEAVWAVFYQAAADFLTKIRGAKWLKAATSGAQASAAEASADIQSLVQEAVKKALETNQDASPKPDAAHGH